MRHPYRRRRSDPPAQPLAAGALRGDLLRAVLFLVCGAALVRAIIALEVADPLLVVVRGM